jgi:regulator of protease activity HflC (stomatin/prohibitin superfamily)
VVSIGISNIVIFLPQWGAVGGVANAVEQVSLTTLRTVLEQHTLDDILKAQDTISKLMQQSIDAVTGPGASRSSACR